MDLSAPPPARHEWKVRFAAGLLLLLAWLALAGQAWHERRDALVQARGRAELLARVLEDHATRSLESAALVLRTLADTIELLPPTESHRLQPLLTQALLAQPTIRSMAVLDLDGHVFASSNERELGLRIDLARLGRLPDAGRDQLLALLPGRGLRSLVEPTSDMAVHMLPMLRRFRGEGGQELLLLALINPDALASYQQTALGSAAGLRAVLASRGGQLLAATEQVQQPLGSSLAAHPVLQEHLPRQEHGSYIGAGLQPGPQVVVFRASRSRALLVLVEQDVEAALARWRGGLWLLGLAGLLALLFVGGAARFVLRSMRARERARQALAQAHEQVAQRERELSVLLGSVQELIFRTDPQGRLVFVNERWRALDRQRAAHAIGSCLHDWVEAADREQVRALFEGDEGPGARATEASIRTSAGELRRFQIAVAPLQGPASGFAGSAVDVTERHVAEQRLQQQLAFTGLLLEISPQPISMFDANQRYVTVNRAWEEFTGRQRADIIGQPVGHFMPAEERRIHDEQDALLRAQGGRISYETRLSHRDGTRRDILVSKVLVANERGGAAGILCNLMDVSEFRTAERTTLEARDAAEEASRAKSEFIANISHELRTPLQSILGFSELGMTRAPASTKLAGMFGDINASGQRMLALVNDLLDVSKIESAVGTFDLERCDLRHLMQGVMRELDPLLAQRGLQWVGAMPAAPLIAKVDPLRFQQVMRNVLANAIKFSPVGGAVELSAQLTSFQEVHISVADRGPGIPAGELDQIFEAFVQSSQTKDGSGGTGLGLAICRKIVEIHGGRIYVSNRSSGGARFHIHLPLRPGGDTGFGKLS